MVGQAVSSIGVTAKPVEKQKCLPDRGFCQAKGAKARKRDGTVRKWYGLVRQTEGFWEKRREAKYQSDQALIRGEESDGKQDNGGSYVTNRKTTVAKEEIWVSKRPAMHGGVRAGEPEPQEYWTGTRGSQSPMDNTNG